MTKDDLAHPHDLLVRNFLVDIDVVADILRNYLDPALVERFDLEQLRYEPSTTVGSGLTELIGDLRFSTVFKGTDRRLEVFIFIEHQSVPDRFLVFRVLRYLWAAYDEYLARDSEAGQTRSLPYPVVVVLYQGKKPWKKVPQMRDLIGAVPGVDTDLLRIPVHLIDLATIPEDQLRGGPIVVALLWALKAASAGLLADRIEPIMETAGKADRDFRFRARIEALTRYAIAVCRHKNKLDIISRGLARVFGKKEADTMSMTIAEELMMEGEARGVAKGKAEGIVEGRAKGIVSVLEIRFGPLAEERKTSIMSYRDLTRLDSLTALAVTCPDVDAFFAALA